MARDEAFSGKAESTAAMSTAASCPIAALAERPARRFQLSETRDVGAFASGLAEAVATAHGAPAASGVPCSVGRLRCGQSVTGDLASSACGLEGGLAADLWQLPLVAGQDLRLELHGDAASAGLTLADPKLRLRDGIAAVASDRSSAVSVVEVVDETGLWGVAVSGGPGDGGAAAYRLDVSCDGLAVGAAPPNGVYSGTHDELGDMRLEVQNNAIVSYTFENFSCPFGSVPEVEVSFDTGCPIAANGSFSCGNLLGCVPFAVSSRVIGAFSGNTVAGTFEFNNMPNIVGSCCDQDLLFTADVGGGQSAPAAPSELAATPMSSTAIHLTWQDNSDNEDDFRVEQREGSGGTFEEVGTASANATAVTISGLDPGTEYTYRVSARNSAGFSDFSNLATATTPAGAGDCAPSATTLCLQQDRFAVEVTFRTEPGGPIETAEGYEETSDSGLFFFFEASNLEQLVKVLNGCGLNGHFWVFFAATTDLEFTVRVTDTKTGQVKTYSNALGHPADAVTDTVAFPTCTA